MIRDTDTSGFWSLTLWSMYDRSGSVYTPARQAPLVAGEGAWICVRPFEARS